MMSDDSRQLFDMSRCCTWASFEIVVRELGMRVLAWWRWQPDRVKDVRQVREAAAVSRLSAGKPEGSKLSGITTSQQLEASISGWCAQRASTCCDVERWLRRNGRDVWLAVRTLDASSLGKLLSTCE
jgi:hypothetical protein